MTNHCPKKPQNCSGIYEVCIYKIGYLQLSGPETCKIFFVCHDARLAPKANFNNLDLAI